MSSRCKLCSLGCMCIAAVFSMTEAIISTMLAESDFELTSTTADSGTMTVPADTAVFFSCISFTRAICSTSDLCTTANSGTMTVPADTVVLFSSSNLLKRAINATFVAVNSSNCPSSCIKRCSMVGTRWSPLSDSTPTFPICFLGGIFEMKFSACLMDSLEMRPSYTRYARICNLKFELC